MSTTSLLEDAVAASLFFSRFPMSEASDKLKELATKAVGGDSNALNDLVLALDKNLKQTARSRGRGLSREDIDDVVQNAFVELFKPGVLKKFEKDPPGIVPFLHRVVINKALNLRQQKGIRGQVSKSVAPEQLGKLAGGRGGARLGPESKKIVRAAVKRALVKAKLNPQEREFIARMFGGTEFELPKHGAAAAHAKAAGVTPKGAGSFASRAKKKFLAAFCTDKTLCDLVTSIGRARTKTVKIPGLGVNVCKGVKGSCVEDVARGLGLVAEADTRIDEGSVGDLLLSWLKGALIEG